MRQHTIEIFMPNHGRLQNPLVLLDKDTYNWKRATKFTQHHVLVYPQGEFHICVQGGKLSVPQMRALIEAWMRGDTMSIDVNTGVITYQRRENASP